MKISSRFKNLFALSYLFVTYGTGIVLLTLPAWAWNVLGIVFITHALLLATAFTHEFIHGNIFKERSLNAFWGRVMTHLNGACYATWEHLVEHHFNHHIYHVDFIPFDYPTYVKNLNPLARRVLMVLEWAYLPVFELILRWHVIATPFKDPAKGHLRGRTLLVMAYRVSLLALLGWVSWKAVLLYAIAYVCFVAAMRFVDTFHHTYEYAIAGESIPKQDRDYEQDNTFSNLVSIKYPLLNLLYLNFGYHNAHHHNMRCPWHELPQLHRQIYGDDTSKVLTFAQFWKNYHGFRLDRLVSGQGDSPTPTGQFSLDTFTGAVGVSFLTPP